MKTPGPSAIIFDFDGTLVDASQAICLSFNQVLSQHGLPEMRADIIRAMIGRPLVEMFSAAAQGMEVSTDRLLAEYRRVFLPRSLALSQLLPGADAVVRHFHSRSKLAIATSRKSDGALSILQKFNLHPFFSAIVGIEDVARPKPDPEPVERALQLLEVSPRQAVMVGDTVDDILAGKRAGLMTVGVTSGAFSKEQLMDVGADRSISYLGELVQILPGWPAVTGSVGKKSS